MFTNRVAAIVASVEDVLKGEERTEAIALKAALAACFIIAAERVRRLRSARTLKTVTNSVPIDPESRLLTADEAAVLAGPSFTAKRLYRLRGNMPIQAWVRKGGRLYFRDGPFRRWLAMR